MIISISYDLNNPGQHYERVIAEIKGLGSWIQPMKSMWFVDTVLTIEQAYNRVAAKMDKNDYLFVDRVTAAHRGWLRQEVVDWLNTRRFDF